MHKFHKANGYKGSLEAQTVQERKAREDEKQQIDHYYEDYYPSEPDQYASADVLYWDWENTWEDWQHTWSP